MMLTCEKLRQMVKGSLADKLAVAMGNLPTDCASELFLVLSKDVNDEVRSKVAVNESIPKDSVCRVLGRLHKDKADSVRDAVNDNIRFNSECDGANELPYSIQQWYDVPNPVNEATANCNTGCNYPRLIGELEAQDVAVASVEGWKNDDGAFLHDMGFDFVPKKISWQLDLSRFKSFDEYLENTQKKGFILDRKRKFDKENIKFVRMPVKSSKYFDEWYAIYKGTMEAKDRGRIIVKEDSPPIHLHALYAVKDDVVLGGILYSEGENGFSAGYGAFLRKPSGLTDVGLTEMIRRSFETGKRMVALGMDTNFYGYHLSTGLYPFKKSLGFVPHEFTGRKYFKVLNDEAFTNPYMYLGYSHWRAEEENSKGLRNNIFVRGDVKVPLDMFNAPEGIRIHHAGKTFMHYPEKGEYFQDGKIGEDD